MIEPFIQTARGPLAPAAQWVLGDFRLRNASTSGPLTQARDWLELAADAGAGFQHAAWEIGWLRSTLHELREAVAAVAAFARACVLGYPRTEPAR